MSKPFNELRERLLHAGVAPRHVRRYVAELADHLADLRAEEERAGSSHADAESAALARLGNVDDLARALIEQRHFQSWCHRAPWAVFGLAPLFVLGGAYFAACLILWSGWMIFLPGSTTPFVRIDGLAVPYFFVGRMLYFYSPVLVGWGIGFVAARQRINAILPIAGLALIALIGAAAQVHTSPPPISGATGVVSMTLAFGSSFQAIASSLIHAALIFTAEILPYLVWRMQKVFSHPA